MADWDEIVDDFRSFLLTSGKLEATADSYQRDARGFLRYLAQIGVSPDAAEDNALREYSAHLSTSKREKTNSVRRSTIGIRQFYRFLTIRGQIADSPFEEGPIPAREEDLPKDLMDKRTMEQALEAAKTAYPEYKGLRDALLVALMGYDGIKVSEAILLRWKDVSRMKEQTYLSLGGRKKRVIHCDKVCDALFQSLFAKLSSQPDPKLTPQARTACVPKLQRQRRVRR